MKLFDVLLRAFPREFRDRFGQGMRYGFRRELDRARSAGAGKVVWLWVGTATSMTVNGIAERATGGVRTMKGTTREFRHAVRRLSRHPGFAISALITLALGIGGTTSIFSVIESVILRPLPYQDDDRLVVLEHESATGRLGMNSAAYLHYGERSQSVTRMGVWIEASAPIAGLGEPVELNQIIASRHLLATLGVEPFLGRGFVTEDHEPGAAPVVLVSHAFWVQRLGGDPGAVGDPVLPGSSEIVVGVLPAGFEFVRPEALVVFGNGFDEPDVYYPLEAIDPTEARFGNFIYGGVGRLAPGATVDEARRELETLMYEATEAYPGGIDEERLRADGFRPRVETIRSALVGDVAGVLWMLLAAVGFVLIIALANVANLFLVRAEARTGEIAVRRALGASRGAVGLTFASEAVILALLGGVLGVGLATIGTEGLLRLVPGDVPRLDGVRLNAIVLSFAVGVSALTALVLAWVPAVRNRRVDVGTGLGEGGRSGGGSRRGKRVRHGLLVSQIAFSLVLLVGSALLASSFRNLGSVDPGFEPSDVLTLRLPLSGSILSAAGFEDGPADRRRTDFMLQVVERLETLPGVQSAAFSTDLPLDGDEWHDGVATEGDWPEDDAGATQSQRVFVGPGYLSTIGARIVRGRDIQRQDFAEQPRVAVVNESFARRHWPDQDPLGRRLAQYTPSVDPEDDVFYTVVGVVSDIREASLMTPPEPTVYYPSVFLPEGGFSMWISNLVAVVRTEGEPEALLPAVRGEILRYRPDVPIKEVATLEEIAESSFAEVRFSMTLIGIAAAVSLLLGVVGIYGSVSYVVARRTRELGLRIALGASGSEVSWGVLRRSAVVALQGLAVGLVTALLAGRVLESMLFGVSAASPSVYGAVSAVVLGVVLAASLLPALRAARIDPMVAMRAE